MTNKSYIVRYILLKIATGQYGINHLIPSEYKLAANFGCARITVHNAYETLKNLGVVHTIKGSGFYVKHSIDEYTNKSFACLYQQSTNAAMEVITYEHNEVNYYSKFANKFSLYINRKLIASSYYLSPVAFDLKAFDSHNINISKLVFLAGNDDFFNVRTEINYQNYQKFAKLLNLGNHHLHTPLIVNYLYSSNQQLTLIVITHIHSDFFTYSANKLIY